MQTETLRRRWSTLAAVSLAMLWCMMSLTACNTVEGAGKDIEKSGEAIQDAAD